MTKISTGDWVAGKYAGGSEYDQLVKLPTDPRTLLRVYRAAMKWYEYNIHSEANGDDTEDRLWFMCRLAKKAQKAKRVK